MIKCSKVEFPWVSEQLGSGWPWSAEISPGRYFLLTESEAGLTLKNSLCLNFLTFSPHPCLGWFDNCPGNPLSPGVWPHSTSSSKSVSDVARGQLQNHRRGQASGAHGPPWGLGASLPRASSLHRASAGSALLPHRAGVRSKRDHRNRVPVSPAGVGGP